MTELISCPFRKPSLFNKMYHLYISASHSHRRNHRFPDFSDRILASGFHFLKIGDINAAIHLPDTILNQLEYRARCTKARL